MINYNKFAFKDINDRKYRNWDGFSLIYSYDFIRNIEKYLNMDEINVIFEIGSRDGCQSMELSDWFPNSTIHLFEPVEYGYNYCSEIQTISRPNIYCHKIALSDKIGEIDFYEVVNGNIGASSLLETKDKNSDILWRGHQKKIKVDTISGDEFIKNNNLTQVDLIWMDVQGAEKIVLDGFSKNLKNVKSIYTEIAVNSSYKNGVNLNEFLEYMDKIGFTPIDSIGSPNQFTEFDIIFLNKKYKND